MKPLNVVFLSLVFASAHCASKKNNSRSGSSSTTSSGETLQINPLAESYPEGLAVSVFSEEASDYESSDGLAIPDTSLALGEYPDFGLTDSNLSDTCTPNPPTCYCSHAGFRASQANNTVIKTSDDFKNPPVASKIEESQKILRAEDDVECFSEEIIESLRVIMHTTRNDSLRTVFGYDFDWGLESAYEISTTGAAIKGAAPTLIAFTQAEIAGAQSYVDFATKISEAMICQGKKDGSGRELDVDESLSVSDSLEENKGKNGRDITIEKATMTRLANSGEYKVYRNDITVSAKDPIDKKEITFEFHMVHSPRNDDNSKYQGSIWVKHNIIHNSCSKNQAISLSYDASQDDADKPQRLNFELRMGEFNGKVDPFTDQGVVDFNVAAKKDGSFAASGTNTQDQCTQNINVSKMKQVTYDGYPSAGVMKFSYWRNPGENYKENARGFVFNTSLDKKNVLRGCGVSGASAPASVMDGISIRKAIAENLTIAPKGWLRPMRCGAQYGQGVWRQCFVQNTDGSYSIDKSEHPNNSGVDFISPTDSRATAIAVAPPPKLSTVKTEISGSVETVKSK